MRRRSRIGLASLATMAGASCLVAGTAVANASAPVIVTCKTSTANTSGSGSLGGCNQPTVTKGSGKSTASVQNKTFSIVWKSGLTTTGTVSYALVQPSTCPATYPTEVKVSQVVTGGTAKTLIGGKGTNTLCANTTTGKVILLPGTKYKV